MVNLKHGMHKTRTYRIWKQMRYRCTNPNAPEYKNYGGRGITFDERWNEFENFLEDMGEPEGDLTIERRDNNKGYSKENCFWATFKQQSNNKRTSRKITALGKTQTITQWSEETGIPVSTLRNRMFRSTKRQLTLEQAIDIPKFAQQRGKLDE